jgi:hypothetical protein
VTKKESAPVREKQEDSLTQRLRQRDPEPRGSRKAGSRRGMIYGGSDAGFSAEDGGDKPDVSRYLMIGAIAVVALLIAANPNSGTIMGLVENAWGVFGAAFGPVLLLALFWRRFNFQGALAGIITGAAVDILWLIFLKGTGIYEIIPGFIAGLLVSVLVAKLTPAPSDEVTAIFDKVASGEEIDAARE